MKKEMNATMRRNNMSTNKENIMEYLEKRSSNHDEIKW